MACAELLDLEEVEAVGRACAGNDVLMAAAAGKLGYHIFERDDQVDGVTLADPAGQSAPARTPQEAG